MRVYDVVIVGAGAAGLCLARRLLTLGGVSVALVDGARDDDALRSYSAWRSRPSTLDALVRHRWSRVSVVDAEGRSRAVEMTEHRYETLFFAELQREVKEGLARDPAHRVVEGLAGEVREGGDGVEVDVEGEVIRGRWLFDSRFRRAELSVEARRWHLLWQRFAGWVVRADRDVFDPTTVTLFDFRVDAPAGTAFVYVLPFGPREALVELVSLRPIDVDAALTGYLRDALGLDAGSWVVTAREAGSSPMTEGPFTARRGARTRTIGIPAGRLKPSTGYALTRIEEDAERVALAVVEGRDPCAEPPSRALYRWLDGVFLELWSREPWVVPSVFAALLRPGRVDRALRFLDERASAWDLAVIVSTLPLWPFARAALRWAWRRLGGVAVSVGDP